MNPALTLTESDLAGLCLAACRRANPDNPLAAAEAVGLLLDVARRMIESFGGVPGGPCVTTSALERAARVAYMAGMGVPERPERPERREEKT